MISMLYLSTAARPFPAIELSALLQASRERNGQLGITGLLLFKNQQFMQLLEGDDEHVTALYARIAADTRHKDLKLLLNNPTTTRHFPEWSMAFRAPPVEFHYDTDGYADFLDPSRGRRKTWQNPTRAQWLLDWFRLRPSRESSQMDLERKIAVPPRPRSGIGLALLAAMTEPGTHPAAGLPK